MYVDIWSTPLSPKIRTILLTCLLSSLLRRDLRRAVGEFALRLAGEDDKARVAYLLKVLFSV